MAPASIDEQDGQRFPEDSSTRGMNGALATVARGDSNVAAPQKLRPSAAFMRKNSLRLYAMPENNRTRTGRPCFDDLAQVESDDEAGEQITQKTRPSVRFDLGPSKKVELEDEETGSLNDKDNVAHPDRLRRKSQMRCGIIAGTVSILIPISLHQAHGCADPTPTLDWLVYLALLLCVQL